MKDPFLSLSKLSLHLFRCELMVDGMMVMVVVVALSSHARILGRNDESFLAGLAPPPPSQHRLVHAYQFHCLGQGQLTVAKQAETTVDEPAVKVKTFDALIVENV